MRESDSNSLRESHTFRDPSKLETVEDVQEYFTALGAKEECLKLLEEEQVDGVSLVLFSNEELRDNFKLGLGVLKKHNENLKRKAEGLDRSDSNVNRDAIERAEREAMMAKSEAERERMKGEEERRKREKAEQEREIAMSKMAMAKEDARSAKEREERERQARRAAETELRNAEADLKKLEKERRHVANSSVQKTGIHCKTCRREMQPGETYVKKKGKTYCQDHGYEKCKGCKQKLTGTYLKYRDYFYHNECFKCSVCQTELGTTFYASKTTGKPVCKKHSN